MDVTNGQIDSAHYGPIGDAARQIASYCEGDARSNVYTAAFNALTTAQSEAAELRKEVAKYRDGYADLYHMMNRADHDDAATWKQATIAVGNFIYLKFGADFARAALKETQHEG